MTVSRNAAHDVDGEATPTVDAGEAWLQRARRSGRSQRNAMPMRNPAIRRRDRGSRRAAAARTGPPRTSGPASRKKMRVLLEREDREGERATNASAAFAIAKALGGKPAGLRARRRIALPAATNRGTYEPLSRAGPPRTRSASSPRRPRTGTLRPMWPPSTWVSCAGPAASTRARSSGASSRRRR